MAEIVKYEFEKQLYSFNLDGWFNATEAAKRFEQEAHEWLRLPSTKSYMEALARALGFKPGKSRFELVRTKRGGRDAGTWLHPKMAVAFARWLSDDFGVWCDLQIDSIIRSGIRAEANTNLLPLYLRESAAVWEIRFKPEYYKSLTNITRASYSGHAGGTNPVFGYITDKWVYACLLPQEVHAELKIRRNDSQKMHQWLTDGGQELLDKQIALVTSMASTSADMRDFEARMMLVTAKHGQLGIVYPKAA